MTHDDIRRAFAALQIAGIPQPAQWSALDPDTIVNSWAGMLDDVPPHALEAAVIGYIRSGESFWPTPGKLLNLARKAARGPGLDTHAEFRWLVDTAHACGTKDSFNRAIARRHGTGVPRQLADAIRAFGGFHALINTFHTRDSQGLKDFHFRLKDFRAAYAGAEQRIEDAKVLRLVDRVARREIEG